MSKIQVMGGKICGKTVIPANRIIPHAPVNTLCISLADHPFCLNIFFFYLLFKVAIFHAFMFEPFFFLIYYLKL